MELRKFFIVEARHPNVGITTELRVFSTKKEAIECAKQLAKDTADQIDVVSKEGLIARANYDDLRTDGVLFREKDC